jgi:multidrug efflux pump subunit AcrB
MILLGLIALTKLNRQFLPDFGIDVISVTVEWPGATAQDVEESIIEALEPDLRFIDGVDKVRGTASEGQGTVAIEFQPGTDLQRALSDVESAVAQVTTLPEDSERPRIRRIFRYDTIARLVLSGPYDERTLKGFAKWIREDLLARGVDRVTFFGLRDEEIRVETAPETLIIDPRIRRLNGDNVGALQVELVGSDGRAVRTEAFIEAWHEHLPRLPGVEALTITPRLGGPPGRELDIRLRGGDSLDDLKRASRAVRDLLARLPGLSQIDDDLPYGKQEILVELTSRGRALGFSTESVGQQLHDAFEGRIAKRFARGDEEVEVVVSLAESAASGLSVAQFPLRGPTGLEVPLGEVADLRDERGFATIRREDGVRDVAVTAELDETQIRLEQVIAALTEAGLPAIAERHGLTYDFAGRAEEQTRTLADIRVGAVLALLLIYIILAWVFASFTRPLAVMLIIPFGLIGAVLGHLLLGYDLSILSLITLLGLSGILVNDSIILVTAIDRRRAEGMALERAVVDGTCARLRAVILTSGTTIGSLAPLLFETSFQAQFLLPMAITIVFGLMVTTFLVLLLVPAMIGVEADLGALRRRLAQPRPAPAQEQAPSAARAAAHQLVPPSLPG